ncbi:MAG TPA: hypothetical protein VI997_10890 [Candidatus Thermoplasmatota archaeon]|nr:hypothetical protein [Candidatus Thermoplasmatota archaeon]
MEGVTVLANAGCSHCVHALDRLADLAEAEGLAFAAVDVRRHLREMGRWRAAASPLVTFGSRVAIAGVPDAETFHALAAIAHEGSATSAPARKTASS